MHKKRGTRIKKRRSPFIWRFSPVRGDPGCRIGSYSLGPYEGGWIPARRRPRGRAEGPAPLGVAPPPAAPPPHARRPPPPAGKQMSVWGGGGSVKSPDPVQLPSPPKFECNPFQLFYSSRRSDLWHQMKQHLCFMLGKKGKETYIT